jgi:hypothetical protein
MRMRWKMSLLLFSVLLYGAKQTLAQETGNAQQEAIRKQARIDDLRAQLAEIQSELDAISGAKPPQTGTIESKPSSPAPPSNLSPEQQLEAEGKATEEHHTFAEDEQAAPRLYNAPPKAPSKVFLPHYRFPKNPAK